MPGSNKKFTDRDLTWLYGNLLNHYAQLAPNFYDVNSVYQQMQASVHGTLSNYGVFKDLSDVEKAKVITAFNTIFRALPMYRGLPPLQQNTFNQQPPANPSVVYVYNYNTNSRLYNWLLLNSLLHDCNHSAHYPGRFPGGRGIPSSTHHNHKEKSNSSELIALLVVIALAAFAAALAFIAMYYMFSEFLNSAERFYYNEGWLKAALMMASSLAFAASSFLLTITFASMPIIALALAAGLNPAGLVITSLVLLTVIGAAVGAFAMDLLYDSIDKKLNKNSMDPEDPLRFRLTDADERNLLRKGKDPIKVKCAMVALRSEMAKLLDSSDSSESPKPIPSFLSRHFGEGRKVQELLQKVRELRNGTRDAVTVGDLVIDCRTSERQQPVFQYHQNFPAYVPPADYVPPPAYVPSADYVPPPAYALQPSAPSW
ncbi:MAG: hypothetical protein P4L65_10195 [Legionella sp.]|nr:hypothetical protein [Legionella sp.]